MSDNMQINQLAAASSVAATTFFAAEDSAGGNVTQKVSAQQIANFIPILSPQNILYVADNGSDSTGNGSFGNPLATIFGTTGAYSKITSPTLSNQWLVIDERTGPITESPGQLLPYVSIRGNGTGAYEGDISLNIAAFTAITTDAFTLFGGYFSIGAQSTPTWTFNFSSFSLDNRILIYLEDVNIAQNITYSIIGNDAANFNMLNFAVYETRFNTFASIMGGTRVASVVTVSSGVLRKIRYSNWQLESMTKSAGLIPASTTVDAAFFDENQGNADTSQITINCVGGNNQPFVTISATNSVNGFLNLNFNTDNINIITIIHDASVGYFPETDLSVDSIVNQMLTESTIQTCNFSPVNFESTSYIGDAGFISSDRLGAQLNGIDLAFSTKLSIIHGDLGDATVDDGEISILTGNPGGCGTTVRFNNSSSDIVFEIVDNSGNMFMGALAGNTSHSGFFCLGLGVEAASAYASNESSNITIYNPGVSGDNNTIRIGVQGSGSSQQNKCFIAGIDGVNVGSVGTVITFASGQLGTAELTQGTGITITPTANTITIAATGGGSGITTLSGDTGTATGATVKIFTDVANAATNCGATISFTGTTSQLLMVVSDNLANTFFGQGAGGVAGSFSGPSNTGFGVGVLQNISSGGGNTGIGIACLSGVETGNYCIGIGFSAGQNLGAADHDTIIIGKWNGTGGASNRIVIGFDFDLSALQTTCFIDGIVGTTVTGVPVLISSAGQLGISVSSERYKKNIIAMNDSSFIYDLNPILFQYKAEENGRHHAGLSAEEVNEINSELVYRNRNGEIESIYYQDLPIYMLNEMIKQQKLIEELQQKLAA